MESILAYILSVVVLLIWFNAYRCRKTGGLFSPIVFFAIYYAYYILYPFFTSTGDIYSASKYDGTFLLLLGAIVSILSMLFGFQHYRPKVSLKSNSIYYSNTKWLAIWLFIIGSVSYFSINGFSINLVAVQTEFYDATQNRLGHSDQYITLLISLLPASACLFYASKSNRLYIILVSIIATIIGVMGGSRYRLFMFFIPVVVFYHLYPSPKKVNLKIWIPAALFFIFSMAVIEKTRNYGSGLDIDKLVEVLDSNPKDIKASEIEGVYYFSSKVMDAYSEEPLIFGDVFGTAICLPIPRAVFHNKPDAQYLRDANIKVLGTDGIGAAYLNIVEWYLALGWLGIILNGLLLGAISKFLWANYINNPHSIGAVLYLSMFDGLGYILISRGYLAQEYVMFVYYLPMIYWVTLLLLKFRKKMCKATV